MSRVIERTWEVGTSPKLDDLRTLSFQGENQADVFRITAKDGDETVAITGTITGRYLGGSNVTVPLIGTIEDGAVVITLDRACYAQTSRFIISIYAENDGENQCIYCGIGDMFRTESDRLSYPTRAISDIQALIDEAQDIIGYVDDARTQAVADIEAKGEEVLATIPEDYTALETGVESLFDYGDGILTINLFNGGA